MYINEAQSHAALRETKSVRSEYSSDPTWLNLHGKHLSSTRYMCVHMRAFGGYQLKYQGHCGSAGKWFAGACCRKAGRLPHSATSVQCHVCCVTCFLLVRVSSAFLGRAGGGGGGMPCVCVGGGGALRTCQRL